MTDPPPPDRSRRDERAEMYRDALLESEEHFRQLVSAVQDYAIFLLDPEGYVVSWNAGAQRIKQYEASEIVGRNFSLFYTPEGIANGLPQHKLEVAAAEGQASDEGWRVRKDGSLIWASVSITALRAADGRLRAFLKIVRDLTERKQADEALRQSEERFRFLVQDVEDYAIFMLDPEGFVQSWNFGAERIKGYTEAEILGKHFSCFYPPETLAQGKPGWLLQKALEYGRIEDEGWRVRKDGEKFWANVVLTALYDRQGNLRGFAKVTRDLTERRKIEALEEADRQKNEFLAVLAHELRNPLTPIRSALHILNQPEVTPKASAQARAIADRQVTHMARLLEDLLDVSRVSEGRIDLRKKIIDLRPTVRAAIESVESLIVGRRQRLTVDMPPDPLWVDVDPIRFEQVLTNLLHNASKYTDPEGEIGVTVEAEGPAAVVRVRDSGVGIDPVMLPRIFDLFVQAERRLDRALGGVGVGLTIVKKLVDLHGGSVQAFSAGKGRGTEFVVRVPRSKMAPSEPERPETSYPPRTSGLRVLVVDDNADAADGLGMLLEMQGHKVEVAYGGEAALAAARRFEPHAVLLDIGMPEMDGYEVARQLRKSPATKSAMLVAITGWGQAEDLRKSREAGFDHHLVKPVEPGAVEHLLAQHQSS